MLDHIFHTNPEFGKSRGNPHVSYLLGQKWENKTFLSPTTQPLVSAGFAEAQMNAWYHNEKPCEENWAEHRVET